MLRDSALFFTIDKSCIDLLLVRCRRCAREEGINSFYIEPVYESFVEFISVNVLMGKKKTFSD